jgi:hypothetical protein
VVKRGQVATQRIKKKELLRLTNLEHLVGPRGTRVATALRVFWFDLRGFDYFIDGLKKKEKEQNWFVLFRRVVSPPPCGAS